MIRSELVGLLEKDLPGLAPREVEQIVAYVFDTMSQRLADGGRVGRNPRTGEPVDVQAKRVPYFKPGKEMRQRLNV
jgi:integration host factor subunit beta